MAFENYYTAYIIDHANFRALYKVARYKEQIERDYGNAYKKYDQIQKMLERTLNGKFIQPIEYEYLYKVYCCKLNLIRNKKVNDSEESIIEKLYLTKPKDFFEKFYDTNESKYYELMENRIKGYQEIIGI